MSKDKSRVYGEIGDPEEWRHQKPTIDAGPFVETDTHILIPTPKEQKSIRKICFLDGPLVEVEETQEEIIELIDHRGPDDPSYPFQWVKFTDPTFGTAISISRAALGRVLCILEGWKDMAEAREMERQKELARKVNTSGLAIAQLPVGRSNGKRR